MPEMFAPLNEPKRPLSDEFKAQLRAQYMTAAQQATGTRQGVGRGDFVESVVLYLYDFTKTFLSEADRTSLASVADEAIAHAERMRVLAYQQEQQTRA